MTDWDKRKLLDDPEDPNLDDKESFHRLGKQKSSSASWLVLRIPFRHFIRVVISLPLGGFLFCVFWAMYTDYEGSTTVICSRQDNRPVKNYLPSLSAAIGDFQLSQILWKICIIVHAPGRFLFASMYHTYLKKVLRSEHQMWGRIACILHVIENIGLIGLTLITSKQNLPIHAFNFAVFIIASEIYMIVLCILLTKCRDGEPTRLELRGLTVKKLFCKVAIVCSFFLFVTYFRHEAKCEEGVYSLFALLEYIVVLSNIGFNGSAYWDFFDRIIVVDLCEPCQFPVYKYSWDY
jgi:hypothetical protein